MKENIIPTIIKHSDLTTEERFKNSYLAGFIRRFERLPNKEEHLAYIKLFFGQGANRNPNPQEQKNREIINKLPKNNERR